MDPSTFGEREPSRSSGIREYEPVDVRHDAILRRLDDIFIRMDEIERAQKRSNSRIIRPALVASISSQVLSLMVLVTAPSFIAGCLVVLLMALQAWWIRMVAPREGRKEWPKDEIEDYDPYEQR